MKKEISSEKNKRQKTNFTRRRFISTSIWSAGAISIIPRHVLGKGFLAPSDRVNLGFIGLGKQSRGLASRFIGETEAQIIAGSDVWTTKTAWFENHVNSLYTEKRKTSGHKGLTTYEDYQKLLNNKDIDGVIVATPDHWHARHAIDAMNIGKDVYCEKPLSLKIMEGIDMVRATKSTKKVLQTGSMQRSWENFRKACELVRNGYLGDIKKILVNVGDPAIPYNLSKEPTPKEIDWNRWCGPAPLLDYNHRLAPSNNDVKFWPDWRLFEETGGGILCDWGAHMFDIVQWALGMDQSGPVRYLPPNDASAVRGLRMFYANGIEMVHEDFGRGWGVRFIGSEGTMDVSRSYLETDPVNILSAELKDSDIRLYHSDNHYQDWLDAIKNRTSPICDVETGHRSATVCNIANIAYKLRKPLEWDPKKEQFNGDSEANALRGRKSREF